MAPRDRGGLEQEQRRGGIIRGPSRLVAPAGIDAGDRKIQRMGREENVRPGESPGQSIIRAIDRKRVVGSIGTAKDVAIGAFADFFQWRSDDERVVSVHLGHDVNFRTVNNPLQSARAVATIQFGAGGGITEVEVDVKRSCCFSLVAGFVNCRIQNDSVAGPSATPMPLRAWLVDRAVANPVAPTRTIYHGALAAAGAQAFGVPTCAAKVRIYREPVAAPFTFNMMNFGLAERVEVNVPALVTPDMLELPGDCSAIEVVNGAVPITRMRLVFELSL